MDAAVCLHRCGAWRLWAVSNGPALRRPPAALPTITTKSGGEMVLIPAGSFEMGSRHGREEEKPVHKVWIDSFLMDRHEVTQAEYEKLGKIEAFPNPSHFQGADLPVEQVTWPQAARYCNARSRFEGLKPCYNEDTGECDFEANGYRLPTEAEWEYACRAGTDSDYSFGSEPRQARRLRLVRRQRRQEDSSGRPEEAQSVGPLRHARQRGRVVPGRLRPGLLQGQPGQEPARTGRRQGIRPPRRLVEIARRRLAVGLPARREPRLLRRLPGPRCHRLPLRAQAAALEGCRHESRRIVRPSCILSRRTMLFHTWVFFVFFLIVYPVYLLVRTNNQLMNIWLMIASYTFYGWWNPWYLLLLFGTSAIDYLMVLLMERKPEHAQVLARDQPGQQLRVPRLLQILRLHHREPERLLAQLGLVRQAARPGRVSQRACSRFWAFPTTGFSPR